MLALWISMFKKKKKQQQIRMCPLDFCGAIQDSAVESDIKQRH